MDKFSRLKDLRSLYRSTFEEWASQVGQLEEIRASAHESKDLSDALWRTAQADTEHRDVRNRLVEEMCAGSRS